ncbi:PQQ-dependent sugar dehydrogenase [Pedobacter immunditicola]|uniref:PQQ-dependent sugar dehydrogenase n=1 Tax=Pedobacter immunditicola TaxID=3133440 RepID=UPI0030A7BDE5
MKKAALLTAILPLMIACGSNDQQSAGNSDSVQASSAQDLVLPAPDTNATKSKFSKVIGWPAGKTPVAPAGFTVTRFAEKIKNPRNIYIAPNGDVLVALSSANTIHLFRDTNDDGKPDVQSAFLTDLNQPYGVLIIGSSFFVANTDGVWRFPYNTGDTKITGKGTKIIDLPAGGYNNHWTRNLIANEANSKIYISVGSGSNVAENGIENEKRRANILEINPDGTGENIFASGLRNPVGMAWAPGTKALWTAVNERDGLGDDLVPDYITSVKKGAFYGWPYSYFGQHEDPRLKGQQPDLVKKAVVPDIAVGAHTATLGLTFYTDDKFPAKYQGGAFIGQHGSWNRSALVGYKVAFIPFKAGVKSGEMEDFLTGFIADLDKGEVYGRPVGVAVAQDGALLVADDVSNIIWRVASK